MLYIPQEGTKLVKNSCYSSKWKAKTLRSPYSSKISLIYHLGDNKDSEVVCWEESIGVGLVSIFLRYHLGIYNKDFLILIPKGHEY